MTPARWCAGSWWWRSHAWRTATAGRSALQPPRTSEDPPTLLLLLLLLLVPLVVVCILTHSLTQMLTLALLTWQEERPISLGEALGRAQSPQSIPRRISRSYLSPDLLPLFPHQQQQLQQREWEQGRCEQLLLLHYHLH